MSHLHLLVKRASFDIMRTSILQKMYYIMAQVSSSTQFTGCSSFTISLFCRKKNNCCPIDNKPLTENDLFPDNFTRREIQNMRKPCPNFTFGCQKSISPLEMETHLLDCSFRERITVIECSFRQCGCEFKANTQSEIDLHVQDEMASHLNVSLSRNV